MAEPAVRREPPGKRPVRRASHGPQITARDLDILRWIGHHGIVTAEQVAARFFPGKWSSYNRLAKIEELGYIRRDRPYYGQPSLIRLTGPGATMANVGLRPAKLVKNEVDHCLAVVDLVEALAKQFPDATVTTERDLRTERYRERRNGARRVGEPGRVPDALFVLKDGTIVAIELDLTSKRTKDFERILEAYNHENVHKVWWYVLPHVAPRLRDIAERNRASNFIDVRTWGANGLA